MARLGWSEIVQQFPIMGKVLTAVFGSNAYPSFFDFTSADLHVGRIDASLLHRSRIHQGKWQERIAVVHQPPSGISMLREGQQVHESLGMNPRATVQAVVLISWVVDDHNHCEVEEIHINLPPNDWTRVLRRLEHLRQK